MSRRIGVHARTCATLAACAAALVAGLASAPARALSIEPPAPAPVKPVTDTYFGTAVADPYRWLENVKDPEVERWMRAQADYARAVLDAIPGRDALRKRIDELDSAVPARVIDVQRRPGQRVFFQRRGATENQFKLYVRDTKGTRLLVDPEVISKKTGTPHAINYTAPSWSGRYVAYGLSAAGSEDAELFVVDADSGRTVLGPITRAQYGAVGWLPDDSGLFFNRLQEMTPGMQPVEKFQKTRAVFVRLADGDRAADRAVTALSFESPGVKINPAQDSPMVVAVHGTPLALGLIFHGTDREITAFVTPLADAAAGRAHWRKIVDRSDDITAVEIIGTRLIALTHRNASRFNMIETSVAAPDFAKARTLMAGEPGVLTGFARASDALYVTRRDGAVSRLFRLPLAQGTGAVGAPREIKLPVAGSFETSGADPRLPGVLLSLNGWTRGVQIYQANAQGVTNTGLQPRGRFDALPDYVATEVLVKSHDGAMVPLSIIHKKGLKRDGSAPTLLWGYASYGITEEPWFSAWRIAWLERGGVFAVANPRGSGAFGQDWYKAGFQTTKPNTWKDFIATAEYLVANKYTSPARLGIWGGSAGGILVGRAMTERPDLFRAVISSVGVNDAVRAELTPNGVPNIPEFGTHTTESGFRALLAMSTYHHVVDGTKYPAVLFTHGVNDPRVDVWQSSKAAARMQAATGSGRPVLLRLDFESGHGVGDTREQINSERADVLAFLLWQSGLAQGASPANPVPPKH
jgi:prolyl oligopeptidase